MSKIAIDWNKYMSGLSGKANIAADNFDAPGKEKLSNIGMPSNRWIDLALGVDGSKYTAPANGWLLLCRWEMNPAGYLSLRNTSAGFIQVESRTTVVGSALRNFIPAKKGDVIQINYDGATSKYMFRFIYAEGSF